LPDGAECELAANQNLIENCVGAVKIPAGIAGPLRVRGMFASGDYYALAGEISLTSAICANEFVRAHQKLARGRNAGQKADHA